MNLNCYLLVTVVEEHYYSLGFRAHPVLLNFFFQDKNKVMESTLFPELCMNVLHCVVTEEHNHIDETLCSICTICRVNLYLEQYY